MNSASFLSSTICLTLGFLSHIMFSAPAKACNQLSEHVPQCMHTVRDVNVQNGKAISDFFLFFRSFFFDTSTLLSVFFFISVVQYKLERILGGKKRYRGTKITE